MEKKWTSAVSVLVITAMFLGLSGVDGKAAAERADLVIKNGKIVTLDPAINLTEALAVKGNRIKAVGTTQEMEALIGPFTKVIDLKGRPVIPGFIEGHGHLPALGRVQMMLDLTMARNWDDIVAMVAEAAQRVEPGAWIQGWGWHQEKWDKPPRSVIDGLPTHHDLSGISPHNPVRLTHASGHASFVNGKALELAGIGPDTPDPPGGEIVRDPNGQPIGMLRESAQDFVRDAFERY
jgi:predicted amidohydrolase YtcJ